MAITRVYIIYNPNSTGDGKKNAIALRRQLQKVSTARVTITPTKHAGHGETLARDYAQAGGDEAMIISSSGDGGYHEVVNGVLGSTQPRAVTGVLPSGNANDHYHFVHEGSTARQIAESKVRRIDVLKVTTPGWVRYAHSYVGLGMTPQIGRELTRHRLTPLLEKWLVIKHFFRVRPVKIRVHGQVVHCNNMVFSNTGRMSKYLTLSNQASVTDGMFEVTRTQANTFGQLTAHLLRAAGKTIDQAPQASRYSFTCLRRTSLQLDGEIHTCNSGDTVVVTCEHRALRTIV